MNASRHHRDDFPSVEPHPAVPDPRAHETWSVRFADRVAGAFGTMATFWMLVIWQVAWMGLATLGVPLLRNDPYPFVFCLFLSNLIQLWALPILGTATNRADQRREAKACADHQALTSLHHAVDRIAAQVEELAARDKQS